MSSDTNNISKSILAKIGQNLYQIPNQPVFNIKNLVYDYFKLQKVVNDDKDFDIYENLDPIVSVVDNFDLLLIPADHPARSKSDTYYVDPDHVLRTHTSAHQNKILKQEICLNHEKT